MAEPQKVEDVATEAVEKISEAVKGATDEQKEEAKEKVAEAKNSVASFLTHGLSKAEGLVHSAKDFVDKKGVKIEEKVVQVSDSWASLVKGGPSGDKKAEDAPLPVSDKNVEESSGAAKSSEPAAVDAGGVHGSRDIPPSAENQPLLGATPPTQTSWKNCCGLLDCLNSSSE